MSARLKFKALLAIAFVIPFSTQASANMLVTDISGLKVPASFSGKKWELDNSETESMKINCIDCKENVIVNIQLSKRENFGTLGIEKGQKAKADCLESKLDNLLCDTIIGTQEGDVSGLQSTVKILDSIYIASYILGDEKTLIQIRTKADTKDLATKVNNDFFQALKSEIIKP